MVRMSMAFARISMSQAQRHPVSHAGSPALDYKMSGVGTSAYIRDRAVFFCLQTEGLRWRGECGRGHLEQHASFRFLSFKMHALNTRDMLGPSITSDWKRLISLVICLDTHISTFEFKAHLSRLSYSTYVEAPSWEVWLF